MGTSSGDGNVAGRRGVSVSASTQQAGADTADTSSASSNAAGTANGVVVEEPAAAVEEAAAAPLTVEAEPATASDEAAGVAEQEAEGGAVGSKIKVTKKKKVNPTAEETAAEETAVEGTAAGETAAGETAAGETAAEGTAVEDKADQGTMRDKFLKTCTSPEMKGLRSRQASPSRMAAREVYSAARTKLLAAQHPAADETTDEVPEEAEASMSNTSKDAALSKLSLLRQQLAELTDGRADMLNKKMAELDEIDQEFGMLALMVEAQSLTCTPGPHSRSEQGAPDSSQPSNLAYVSSLTISLTPCYSQYSHHVTIHSQHNTTHNSLACSHPTTMQPTNPH